MMIQKGSMFLLLLLSVYLSSHHTAQAVVMGEEVCITGYVMDNFCLEYKGGRLLDNDDVITLQNPEKHSFHCLLDVGLCYRSGYQVLGPKNPDTDRHCLGFRIEETDAVLTAGRALGKMSNRCSTCESEADSAPEFGYRATVKGVVSDLGDGSEGVAGTPIISNVQLLDQSVGCDGSPTIPPMCTLPIAIMESPSDSSDGNTTMAPDTAPAASPSDPDIVTLAPSSSPDVSLASTKSSTIGMLLVSVVAAILCSM